MTVLTGGSCRLRAVDWSLLISGAAIAIALFSLRYTHRADERAKRAEERADRAEKREEKAAVARRRAKPAAVIRGNRGSRRAETIDYWYEVRNAGQGTLTELYLWHQTPEGDAISGRTGSLMVLVAGEAAEERFEITVRAPYPDVQHLWFEWVDDEGRHSEFSGIVRSMEG